MNYSDLVGAVEELNGILNKIRNLSQVIRFSGAIFPLLG